MMRRQADVVDIGRLSRLGGSFALMYDYAP